MTLEDRRSEWAPDVEIRQLGPSADRSEAANRAAGFFFAVSVINEWRTFQELSTGVGLRKKK